MFKVGDEVEHIKLGKGTIELKQKSGEKNIYLINFESGKRHWCTDCTLKEEEEKDIFSFDKDISAKMKKHMKKMGMTHEQTAKRMGISKSRFEKYMNCTKNRKVTAEILYKFCKLFDLDMMEMCEDE